jgi:hypothetical protein
VEKTFSPSQFPKYLCGGWEEGAGGGGNFDTFYFVDLEDAVQYSTHIKVTVLCQLNKLALRFSNHESGKQHLHTLTVFLNIASYTLVS